jgi:hypothetical protein
VSFPRSSPSVSESASKYAAQYTAAREGVGFHTERTAISTRIHGQVPGPNNAVLLILGDVNVAEAPIVMPPVAFRNFGLTDAASEGFLRANIQRHPPHSVQQQE